VKAFKVYDLNPLGYEDEVNYYRRQRDAERDFYNRVRNCIEQLPLVSKKDLDGGRPWKISDKHCSDENIILAALFQYWDSCHTDCGTEWDIESHEICLEVIEVM
jgi:hypothetical protein